MNNCLKLLYYDYDIISQIVLHISTVSYQVMQCVIIIMRCNVMSCDTAG